MTRKNGTNDEAPRDVLEKALREAGLSAYGIAKTTTVSASAVARWLNGETKPRRHNLEQVARLLDDERAMEVMAAYEYRWSPVTGRNQENGPSGPYRSNGPLHKLAAAIALLREAAEELKGMDRS